MIQGNDILHARIPHVLITAGLIIAVLIEAYAHSILLYNYDKTSTSIIYVIAGVFVAVLPLFCQPRQIQFGSSIVTYLMWAGLLLIFYLIVHPYASLLASHPLDYKTADMLPIMEVMASRFISGGHAYDKIQEIWQGIQPIYLPAMWLPFVVSTLLDIDPRWITLSAIILGILAVIRIWDLGARPCIGLIVLLPVYWMITSFLERDISYLLLTQEGVVIGYYLFFGYALTRNNPYLIGFSGALCLMSRFSLIFWLIAFGCYLLFSKDFKYFIKAAVTCLVTTGALLIVTGAIFHLDIFLGLQRTYLHAIRPSNDWKYSGMIENGLGFARFWGYEGLKQLHCIFLLANILIPILVFGAFLLFRKNISRPILALGTLKLSLVLFYNLLIIPAGYLFYTSTAFSLVILYYWLAYREGECLTAGKFNDNH